MKWLIIYRKRRLIAEHGEVSSKCFYDPNRHGKTSSLTQVRALEGAMVDVLPHHRRGAMMRLFATTAVTCIVVYMALAGSMSATEWATGAVLGILTAAWGAALRRVSSARFRFSRAHLAPWTRALLGLPAATWRTGVVLAVTLLRPVSPGRTDRVAFRPGPAHEPGERARRATALLAASLAPASYVVCADNDGSEILLHGIGAAPGKLDRDWLI
jgi:multisubunit Na+/H+ antiporter MnhE subunit